MLCSECSLLHGFQANMAGAFKDRITFGFCLLLTNLLTIHVTCQPVITEEFLYGEHCHSSPSSNEKLRKHIDLIMDELQRQNQENMLLKEEVESLKMKHKEQKLLLTQLTSTMADLVKKIKLGQKSCTCRTPKKEQHTVEVLSEKASEIEAPNSGPSTSSIPENVQTSPLPNTAVSPEVNSTRDKLVRTSHAPVTPADLHPTLTTNEQDETSKTPPLTGVPSVTSSHDSVQTTELSSEDGTVTEVEVTSGYVAVYPRGMYMTVIA